MIINHKNFLAAHLYFLRILPFLLIFLTFGCSREPLEGTIYVIKGDGGITRAAAIDIHILDFENIYEFDHFIAKMLEQKENSNLSRYLSDECPIFISSKKETLRTSRNMLDQYSNECDEEERNFSELLHPEEIRKKILQEEEELLFAAKKELERRESEILSKIKISYDYSRTNKISNGRWRVVSVTNESPYTVSSGRSPMGAYVAGKLHMVCKDDKVLLDPGETVSFSLGDCYYGTLPTKNTEKLKEEGAEICTNYDDEQFCVDDFAPIVSNSSNEKGEWKIITEGSDLEKILLSLNKDSLLNLESELIVSSNAQSLVQECTLLNAQIVPKISALEELSCPEIGSNREKIQLFYNSADSLGINLSYPTRQQKFQYSDFIATHSIASVPSDINGNFSFQAPPNKNFILYARYKDNFTTMEWVLETTPKVKTLELNNTNALPTY